MCAGCSLAVGTEKTKFMPTGLNSELLMNLFVNVMDNLHPADRELQTGETCFKTPILLRTSSLVNHPASKIPSWPYPRFCKFCRTWGLIPFKLSSLWNIETSLMCWHRMPRREGSVCIRAAEHCRFSPPCTPCGSCHWSHRFVFLFRM